MKVTDASFEAVEQHYELRLGGEIGLIWIDRLMAMGMRYGPVMASIPREVREAKAKAEVKAGQD